MQLWRSLLHLVLLLVDEGVVADRLAHLQVLGLALVVLAGQVLVHVAHLGERLLADRTRVPGFKKRFSMEKNRKNADLVRPLMLLLSSSSMFSLLLSEVVGLPGLFSTRVAPGLADRFKRPFMSPLKRRLVDFYDF